MRTNSSLASLAAAALFAGGLVVASPAAPAAAGADPGLGTDPTVTADALPTVQIDGVVWSQVVVGNTVYVAGQFTTARPAGAAAGTSTVPRTNLLAYDITTGELIESWAPTANGVVHAIEASPDGSQIYVGGAFNRINNVGRSRFAALSASTGAVLNSFSGGTNGEVRDIAVAPNAVYITGTFNTVAGQSRARVASFTPAGALRSWSANVQSRISYGIATSPDGSRVYIGGAFEKVNNVARLGSAALSGSNAALLPWNVSDRVYAWGPDAAMTSVTTDDTNVYFTSMAFLDDATGIANTEGAFAVHQTTADVTWLGDCHGDTYSVFANPGQDHVYLAGHPHMCNNIGSYPEESRRVHRYATALTKESFGLVSTNTQLASFYVNMEGFKAPKVRTFFPTFTEGLVTGQHQATWQVTGNADYVVFGGEFRSVNGVGQQGLVRFAKPHIAPGLRGPQDSGSATSPTVQSHARGTMQVSWRTNHDIDDGELRYRVLRDNVVVHEVTAPSTYWNRPRLSFTDSGLADSTNYSYRIEVSDPSGNVVLSPQVTARTVTSSTAPLSDYAQTVLEDQPNNFWRLGESSGTIQDWTSFSDATAGSGVVRNQEGAIDEDSDRAVRFTGSSNSSRVYSGTSERGLDHLSIEAWFSTSSTSGGKIVGFGSTRGTGNSRNHDRHVYMTPSGQLAFGVHPGSPRTIISPLAYNDDAWHHVVATLGLRGMELYVDGVLVATDPGTVSGQASFTGYWRIGGDNLGGWPDAGATNFTGLIDEVATYGRQLNPGDVVRHYIAGSGDEIPNSPPVAAFTATPGVLSATVDASASTDSDGTIVSYDWEWGDGSTSSTTTPTASHDYATAGPYSVLLTVTDDRGGTGTTTRSIEVAAQNQPPVASFTVDVVGRQVTTNANASTDPDGSVVGYSWSWGDGTAASSGETASHTYAADGTYEVTLTVTDDDGATGVASQSVDVAAPVPGGALASDAFGRTVASGWGSADLGGSWITAGGASVAGGAGLLQLGPAGTLAGGRLPGAATVDLETSLSTVWDKRPAGSGGATLLRGRITDNGEYRFKLEFKADGRMVGWVVRTTASGAETRISDVLTVSGSYSPGTVVRQKMEVSGTSPTTVRVKVWTGAQEPSAWAWQLTDGTAALQGPGHTGIAALLASGANNTPVTVSIDDYLVASPGGTTVPDPDPDPPVPDPDPEPEPGPDPDPDPEPGPASTVASDAFARTVASGWGSADVGGSWITAGGASVADGAGLLQLGPAGTLAGGRLPGGVGEDLVTSLSTVWDKRPAGSGGASLLRGRISDNGEYRFKLEFKADGRMIGWVVRTTASGAETRISDVLTVSGSYSPGTVVRQKMEVTGTSPTTVRVKVWTGAQEPTGWGWQVTDNAGALQAAGHTGVAVLLASGANNTPITVSVDDYLVRTDDEVVVDDEPPAADPEPEPGMDPEPEPGTDPDPEPGTDPEPEPGTDPEPEPGTDPEPEPGTDPEPEPGTDPEVDPEAAPLADDAFDRSESSGWGAADVGGSWVTTAGTSVADGAGILDLGSPGALVGARLPGAAGQDLVTSLSTVWDKRPAGSGGATLLRGRITDNGEYRFKLEFKADGRMVGWVVRTTASGAETRISDVVTVPGTYSPGTVVRQKMAVTGTSPTTVRVKVWTGDEEPSDWGWDVTDGAGALQGSGHTGFAALLASGANNTPVRVSVDDYRVTTGAADDDV